MKRKNHQPLLVAAITTAIVAVLAPYGMAATVEIITSQDTLTTYTVNDPDVGPYQVTISGHSGKTLQEGNYHFRTPSTTSSPFQQDWHIAVSGLSPYAVITELTLGQMKIVPTVGSGNTWDWEIDLSAPLVDGGSFTDHRDHNLTESGTSLLTPPLTFAAPQGDSFGSNPDFLISLTKTNSSTRSLGWHDFTITAVAVPEPSTLAMGAVGLALAGMVVFRRRQRGSSAVGR